MNGLRLVLASVGSIAVLSVSVWMALRRRPTPAERERRRRMTLYEKGRMAEADVHDFGGETVYYSYSVRGVSYEASQDLSTLLRVLQVDSVASLGPATCRYDPRNPANSILACEDWSGLRARSRTNPS